MTGRVLHIVPDNELGGGNANVARLLRTLDHDGRALLPRNAVGSVRELFAPLPHEFGRYDGRGSVVAMARAIARAAAPGDVIHAHGTRAAIAGMLAKWLRRDVRLVYTVRGFHGLAQPGPLGLRRRMDDLLARNVDAMVFLSHADKTWAEESGIRYRCPAQVIHNGIDLTPPPPDAERDVDVLFVGRMVYQKNPQAMVETLALLPRDLRITVVGDGDLSEEIDRRLEAAGLSHVDRRRQVSHAETLALIARARVLVMTSRWEGLPTVSLEATLSRCLVCAFEIPPLVEILDAAAPDCLTPHEPEALAETIRARLADETGRRELVERAHQRALRLYTPKPTAEAYGGLYRSLDLRAGGVRV
ncbi:MAG TPA: glycosyltransferase family 4 protein [Paracoccaceae bacterium]|nr:glycosyltransferase family 4 protein [Paracoccaceae bacterium]